MNKRYKYLAALIIRYKLHLLMTHVGISFSTKFHQLLAERKAGHGSAQRIQRCWDDAVAWFNLNRIKPRRPQPEGWAGGPDGSTSWAEYIAPKRAVSITEGMLANNTRADGTVVLAENGFTWSDSGRRGHFAHAPRHGTWKGLTVEKPSPIFFTWRKDGITQRSSSNHGKRMNAMANEKFVKQRIAFGRIKSHEERLAFASALIKEFYGKLPESKRAEKTIAQARELVQNRFNVSDKKTRAEFKRLTAMLKS